MYFAIASGLFLLRTVAGEKPVRRLLYKVTLVALFLFSAFRFAVGCDWTGYLNQYYVYGVYGEGFGGLLNYSEPVSYTHLTLPTTPYV